jgi:hypothetical protein
MSVKINGENVNDYGGAQEYFNGKNDASLVSYSGFYGPDSGEIIFDTKKEELENLLVIGESYDNAVLKLLSTHHNKTHSIDLRNYEHFMGKKFELGSYIRDNKIDKVLLIGCIDFFVYDNFELECE